MASGERGICHRRFPVPFERGRQGLPAGRRLWSSGAARWPRMTGDNLAARAASRPLALYRLLLVPFACSLKVASRKSTARALHQQHWTTGRRHSLAMIQFPPISPTFFANGHTQKDTPPFPKEEQLATESPRHRDTRRLSHAGSCVAVE